MRVIVTIRPQLSTRIGISRVGCPSKWHIYASLGDGAISLACEPLTERCDPTTTPLSMFEDGVVPCKSILWGVPGHCRGGWNLEMALRL